VAVLLGLPRGHRLPFARCWWALLSTRLRLRAGRRLASGRLRRRELAGRTDPHPAGLSEPELLELFRRALETQVVGTPCLERSLALAGILARYGWPARVEIGMRKGAGGLEGHAWVEREGRVIGEAEGFVGSFVRFTRPA
jgi:hypothetical protein